ncbi:MULTISPECIES: hypothetical protein [unclassified Paraburkholderia]|uniref:hypothetical protein n=1 Tax=unclassified Paraburkholderia TaxID=2615204 RepID=UPI002AB25640|nr:MULTISPECIES: hypothetical protein [unclassified Paraburkholderia]
MEPFNSFLPLQSRLLTPKDVEVVRKHYANSAVHGIMAILGMNGPNGGWAKTIPSFCVECLTEDIALCGAPFWNRANLVPGILFCSRHGIPLSSATCDNCITRSLHPDHHARPGLHCGCGIAPLPGSTDLSSERQEQELELHRVTRKLLDPSYLPNITRDTLAKAIQQRSEEIGLVQGTTLNLRRVREFFNAHPWRLVLERMRILGHVQSKPGYLKGSLLFRNPLQSVALTCVLFDNWSKVEEIIEKSNHPFGYKNTTEPLQAHNQYNNFRKHKYRLPWFEECRRKFFLPYSQKYSDIHAKNRNLTHTEITYIIGGYARNILTKELLHQAGIDVPFYKLSVDMYAQLDIDIAEQIFNKNDELIARGHCGKIHARMLLQDFGIGKYKLLKGYVPFSDAALHVCMNTKQPSSLTTKTVPHSAASARRPRSVKLPVLIESIVQFSATSPNVVEADSPNT